MRILGVLKLRIEFCRFSRGNESGPSRQGHLGHRGKHDFLAVFLATAPLGHRGKNLGPATAPATAMAPAAATAPATATTPATALWRPLCVCSMTDGLRPSRPRTPEINFGAELHLVIAGSLLSKIYFWGAGRRVRGGLRPHQYSAIQFTHSQYTDTRPCVSATHAQERHPHRRCAGLCTE